jgi:hypothetical protein
LRTVEHPPTRRSTKDPAAPTVLRKVRVTMRLGDRVTVRDLDLDALPEESVTLMVRL